MKSGISDHGKKTAVAKKSKTNEREEAAERTKLDNNAAAAAAAEEVRRMLNLRLKILTSRMFHGTMS